MPGRDDYTFNGLDVRWEEEMNNYTKVLHWSDWKDGVALY